MKRTLSITSITLLAVGILFAVTIPVAHAAERIVTNCSSDVELRDDLNTLQGDGGGLLTFACGTATIVLSGAALPVIYKNVAIDGAGKITLSGGSASRIFRVNGGALLSLYNLTLTKGNSTEDGGAIFSEGSLDVNNTKFIENETAQNRSGGAIFTTGPISVTGSQFIKNKAGSGGAVFAKWSAAETTISTTTFSENQATHASNGNGGAILLWDGAGANLSSSTLTKNIGLRGGAIHVTSNSTLTVNQSIINQNGTVLLTAVGGGIDNSGTTHLKDSTVEFNEAYTVGGGVNNYGTLNVTRSTLNNNQVGSGAGGGIYSAGAIDLTNATFSQNTADTSGGAIRNNGGTLTAVNVTFSRNFASDTGDTYATNNAGTFKNTIFVKYPGGLNCNGAIANGGFNLADDVTCNLGIGRDNVPLTLSALQNNGGPTLTHLPFEDSPANDGGTVTGCPGNDQRGLTRPQGSSCDVGAVELQPAELCNIKPAKPALNKPGDGDTVTKAKVKLKWDAATCAEEYKFVVRQDTKDGPKVAGGKTVGRSFKTEALPNGHTYYWQVKACNPPYKCSKSSWWSFVLS